VPRSFTRMPTLEIVKLFAIANENPDASKRRRIHGKRIEPITERRRVAAVRKLLREFRSQLEQLAEAQELATHQERINIPQLRAATPKGDTPRTSEPVQAISAQWQRAPLGSPPQIDRLLLQGIRSWGLGIFAAENPALALERLLGTRQKRGKSQRAETASRNRQITLALMDKMRSGMSLEKAAEALASDYRIEPESIASIYKREHKAVKAEIAMSELEPRG
jgi:hypothetical protein